MTQDPTSGGLFTAGASVSINAPIQVVWDVLTDFSKYPKWNPFVREQLMMDASFKLISEQHHHASDYMKITVHFPPNMKSEKGVDVKTSLEHITLMDDKRYRCEWEQAGMMSWFMSARRFQQLSEPEPGVTFYETEEVFGGPLAYGVKWFVGEEMLTKCFEAMGNALKDTAEAKHKTGT